MIIDEKTAIIKDFNNYYWIPM